MDILMSIRKPWTDKILDGSKTLEFRNNIGKLFKIGSTVYLYESKSNKGLGKVVGEFKIKNIVEIERCNIGTYPFLLYYAKNILKDEETVKAVEKIYDIKLHNYGNSFKIYYIFNPEELIAIDKTNISTDLLSLSKEEYYNFMMLQKKSRKLCSDCDDWLRYIGYYNEFDETFYENYIEIEDYIKYNIPLDLTDFKNQKGQEIVKAPMSWCYVQ